MCMYKTTFNEETVEVNTGAVSCCGFQSTTGLSDACHYFPINSAVCKTASAVYLQYSFSFVNRKHMSQPSNEHISYDGFVIIKG